ncbi:tripartite tricarboxylate transporter substrate binding protein [Roseomonas sp. OT10]|uniref:tripartite tricarboxylate transporter substrate binding protein n=1 Tax=Roseomonas cutis TaxID=2897332 RepID=UPI001E603F64|nr:tripartite tricarboxylate transporter substrate binding protein [Roseomonas sp. OT10]UFN49031.1 tripartite tricarboxylate transporter substrate binding protein [Roseomonas sp. OT10]
MILLRRKLLVTTALGLAAPAIVRAQGDGAATWPDRPLRLIIGWPPGGSTDTVARIFQPRLQEVLGKPVVIENRGGASGSIGAIEAARAAPDGYTWTLVYDTEATNQSVMRLPYKTLEAMVPVSLVGTGPLVLTAHKSTPFQTFAQLVEAAKKAPDTLNYATSGVGGLAHVSTTLLSSRAGIRLVHVPYKGGAPAAQDAVAGHVPLYMGNVLAINQYMHNGTLRPLGVTTKTASRHVPNTRSFAEQGFQDFEAPTWWAFLGRAGTPAPIVQKMHAALAKVLAEEEVKRKIEEQGADVVASSPEECSAFLAREIDRWGQVIRENEIRADG